MLLQKLRHISGERGRLTAGRQPPATDLIANRQK